MRLTLALLILAALFTLALRIAVTLSLRTKDAGDDPAHDRADGDGRVVSIRNAAIIDGPTGCEMGEQVHESRNSSGGERDHV